MTVSKSRKLAFLGIIIGVILASVVNDELTLIQAQTQAQKDTAQFYIGIFSVAASLTALLTSIEIIQTKSDWISFVRSTSATVTLINILFLTVIPEIHKWMKGS